MGNEEHFNRQSSQYAIYRPGYPRELFEGLTDLTSEQDRVWDCATGSGQAALSLAELFTEVHATDASANQIAKASEHPRVRYKVAPCEASGLPADSVDLITVAQAIHWFDHARFYTEAQRVLKPNGVLAIWGYGLCRVSPNLDPIIDHFYSQRVGPFWPPERDHLDQELRTIPFPFPKLPPPDVAMRSRWTLNQFIGYLTTWSAVVRYQNENKSDPVAAAFPELARAWGNPDESRVITWPLYFLITRFR